MFAQKAICEGEPMGESESENKEDRIGVNMCVFWGVVMHVM